MPRRWAWPQISSQRWPLILRGHSRAYPGGEHLGPAPGHGRQARLFEPGQNLTCGHALPPGHVVYLHRGEGLERGLGPGLAQRLQQLQVVVQAQLGVAGAHHVQLAEGQLGLGRGQLGRLLGREGVGVGRSLLAPEGTEGAAVDAHVAVVHVAVDHVEGPAAVQGQAGGVGQGAQAQQVAAGHQGHALLPTQALARLQACGHGLERRVGDEAAIHLQGGQAPGSALGRWGERNIGRGGHTHGSAS